MLENNQIVMINMPNTQINKLQSEQQSEIEENGRKKITDKRTEN